MCITINTASLSKTKILSIPVGNGNHFIAYSNSVKNLSGKLNAMILAIPGETKQEWFYDTTKYKNFLDDIIKQSDYVEDYLGIRSRGLSKGLTLSYFQVGMYSVFLSNSLEEIISSINSQKQDKLEIKEELLNFFSNHYKGWNFAVCMFDTNKTIDAQPIAFEYTPFVDDSIYFPTMDAHTGNAPDLNGLVDVDHTFIYEHTGKSEERLYKEFVELKNENIPSFLNKRRYRYIEAKSGGVINGDTFASNENIYKTPFSKDVSFERG